MEVLKDEASSSKKDYDIMHSVQFAADYVNM
jgi:hypothetical protein